MKKQLFILSAAIIAATAANAQTATTTSTGIGTINPNSSTILDVYSSNKGVLLPRVTLQSVSDATTIATPATGLVVYNTNTALAAGVGLYYNAGTPTTPLWSRMIAVSGASAPATGQTVIWNGTTYVTGNPAIAVAAGTPLSGNGTGSTPLTINVNAAVYNAANIQGKAVSTTAPTNGQVLVWNSTTNKYEPGMAPGDNWGTQVAATSGPAITGNGTSASPLMVNNTSPIFNANQINNSTVSNTTPTNGQTLVYDAASSTYIPGNTGITTNGPTFTGNGTPAAPLTFNGVAVSAPVTGNGTTGSPLSVNGSLPIYNANNLQGKSISTTAPTNGQVLIYNSATNTYVPSAVPGDNWGTQVAATSGAAISGNGTATSPLMVNNTSPIFNANQLNNTSVTGTPTTGQSIVFNGTSYAPGNPAVSAGNGITGNGTTTNPLAFSGISTTGTPLSGNGTTGSPLSINTTLPVYNAGTIQGSTVSTTAPTASQVLVYNGTSYVPGVVNAVQIQGKTISNAAPTNGQVLIYNSTTNSYVPSAVPGDNWGTQTAATSGAAITGNGTSTSPLMVNNTSPIFNANTIQGNTVSTTAPTTNQVLVYNGTSYVPGAVNAVQIQGKTVSNTAPTNGQVLVYNSTTNTYVPGSAPGDNWGTQTAVTSGAAISGNGTAATPLIVNNGSPIFNANKLNNTTITGTPTTGQSVVYNGTSYAPGNPSITTGGTSFTGNGTPGSPLTFGGIVSTAPLSGAGTTASPLTINTASPVYNANSIQGDAVSTTNPTAGQALVWNAITNQYVPSTVISAASNGVNINAGTVRLGGALTQPTTINTNLLNNLTIAGTLSSTSFDGLGNIHLQNLPTGYGNVLVVDNAGVVKQIPASATTFNYNTCNTAGVHISSSQLTGAVPYTQNSSPNNSIPGGGSWTAIPGLTKTISIANPNNTVYFNTEGVSQYDGTMQGNGVTSYSIGIFIDGKLQASRSYTMIGAGSTGQFDTYNLAGQIDDLTAGNHTFAVYVTRRMQQNASDDLYFDGPATIGNTNAFMTRGVLFISGTY